jgi:PKD repeat protein
MATIRYYATIVDYTSGTVVWSLNWTPTSPGAPPYIDNTGLPQEQVGVVFIDPLTGGQQGTATVSATVDGVPIQQDLIAEVPVSLLCSSFIYKFDPIITQDTPLGWPTSNLWYFRVYQNPINNLSLGAPTLVTIDASVVLTIADFIASVETQLPGFSCFFSDNETMLLQRQSGIFAIADGDGTEFPIPGYNYGIWDYRAFYEYTDNNSFPESLFSNILSLNTCLIQQALPVADFSADPLTGNEPLSVDFTDLSTNSPVAWAWDFENNGSTDSTLQNPTHIYPTAGTYSVKLTVKNATGSDIETKTSYIEVVGTPTLWGRKQLYFNNNLYGGDGQVTERSIYTMRQVDVNVTGLYENEPTPYSMGLEVLDSVYNYKNDRVYILKRSNILGTYRLIKFNPRTMEKEEDVSVPAIGPSVISMRIVGTSFDDVWVNEYYSDEDNVNRLRLFSAVDLAVIFDETINEFNNQNKQWQAACGTNKITTANITNDGLSLLTVTGPGSYTITNIPLNEDTINGEWGPNFGTTFSLMRCYNETDDTIWIEYYTSVPDVFYMAVVDATALTVNYLLPPTGKQYEPMEVWWNSFTNTMIMYVGVDSYSTTGGLEVASNGTVIGVHGENTNNNWESFRPSGPYFTAYLNNPGYGTGEFLSGSPSIEPAGLTVDFDDYYGSPNTYRQWETVSGNWTYIPSRYETTAEPVPTYTTIPPASIDLGAVGNGWNSGDLTTTTNVTWYKITYAAQHNLLFTITNDPIINPAFLSEIIIYDSYGRQIQLRDAQALSQNENLPGDYYIAVVFTDQGPANSFTVGYDIFPSPTAETTYTFTLKADFA